MKLTIQTLADIWGLLLARDGLKRLHCTKTMIKRGIIPSLTLDAKLIVAVYRRRVSPQTKCNIKISNYTPRPVLQTLMLQITCIVPTLHPHQNATIPTGAPPCSQIDLAKPAAVINIE